MSEYVPERTQIRQSLKAGTVTLQVIRSLYFLFLFWPHCVACGIFVPGPGTESSPPAVEEQSLNPWTPRVFPCSPYKVSALPVHTTLIPSNNILYSIFNVPILFLLIHIKNKYKHIYNLCTFIYGRGGGIDREFGVSSCKL